MATTWRSWPRTSAVRPESRRRARRALPALALLLLAAACSSSDNNNGGGGAGVTAAFTPSATAAAANLVRLRAGSAGSDMVTVEVALSGVTTSADIYSFAFDLVLSDATVASYVSGSAVVGGVLVPVGPQGTSVLVSQAGSRVVVGVSKTGGGAGNGVGAGEQVVVSLTFRVARVGSTNVTFAGSPSNPQNPTANPAALDSGGAVIGSISFDAVAATISGS